jgi:hypothetical protein
VLAGFFIVLAMTGMDRKPCRRISRSRPCAIRKKHAAADRCTDGCTGTVHVPWRVAVPVRAAAGVSATGDKIFPPVVMAHMPAVLQLIFFIGLISALFPARTAP